LEPGYNLQYERIFNLSEFELRMVKPYIEQNLANGFSQRSLSPAAVLILFAKQKDGELRLSVDYRALNKVMVKNWNPLLLTPEMRDRVHKARIFTKLNLRGPYRLILIKDGAEYTIGFQMY
jgi:hypothetical protein